MPSVQPVFMLLEVDSSAWTAFATVALVFVTAAYVVLTWRLAKNAARSADASERALLLESMPILLPSKGAVGNLSRAAVLIRNAGRQPGLNAKVWVRAGTDSSGPLAVSQVLPGELTDVPLPEGFSFVMSTGEVVLAIEYSDAIGNRYRVERVDHERQHDVSLHRMNGTKWEPLLVANRGAQIGSMELDAQDHPAIERD